MAFAEFVYRIGPTKGPMVRIIDIFDCLTCISKVSKVYEQDLRETQKGKNNTEREIKV